MVIALAFFFAKASDPAKSARINSRRIRIAALSVMGAFACFVAVFGLGVASSVDDDWRAVQLLPAAIVAFLMIAINRWPLEGAVVLSVSGVFLGSAAWIAYRTGLGRYARASVLLCATFLVSATLLFLSLRVDAKKEEFDCGTADTSANGQCGSNSR